MRSGSEDFPFRALGRPIFRLGIQNVWFDIWVHWKYSREEILGTKIRFENWEGLFVHYVFLYRQPHANTHTFDIATV